MPIYPGYVVATAASLLIGRPVKWIEDRIGNLISTGFARDYHMHGELAIKDGKMTGLRASLLSDNGAFFADAQPSRFKAGLFHICTGSYDIPAAHVTAVGAYTNKAPGGVAYRCSFRVTEASYLIERLVQTAAYELGVDPAEFRTQNFIKPEQFPYTSATGFEYDSGDYGKAHDLALEKLGYTELRKEQEAARAEGRLIGIGVASFTEVVGAGPGKTYDIAGLRMFDSAELRVHPTGKAILKLGDEVAGPGPRDDVRPDRRRGARHPGRARGGRGGRHRHDAVRPRHVRQPLDAGQRRRDGRSIARKLRDKARTIAAHLLEASEDDLEWENGALPREGQPRQVEDDPGLRVRGLHEPPRRPRGRARGRHLLRPAEHDVPVRHVRGGRRDRPRHGPVEGAPAWSRSTTAASASTR